LHVGPEAQHRRAVKPLSLHLVVPHLNHEVWRHVYVHVHELAGTMAVYLRQALVVGSLQQRPHPCGDVVMSTSRHIARADVVEMAVLVIEAETKLANVLIALRDAFDDALDLRRRSLNEVENYAELLELEARLTRDKIDAGIELTGSLPDFARVCNDALLLAV